MLHDIAGEERTLFCGHRSKPRVREKTMNNAKLTWARDRVRPVRFPLPVSQRPRALPELEEKCDLSQYTGELPRASCLGVWALFR